jgi:hypothetical protein
MAVLFAESLSQVDEHHFGPSSTEERMSAAISYRTVSGTEVLGGARGPEFVMAGCGGVRFGA